MPNLPLQRDSNQETADDNGGTPRWVKVFGIIALVVILLFVIMLLTRGSHGPARHMRGDGSPSAGITQQRMQQS